jgi:acetolactate decarboxylase
MKMKNKIIVAFALVILISTAAFYAVLQFQTDTDAAADKAVLFQLAAFNTFSAGNYSGFMNYSELSKHGDFGIGTLDGLNGEMLALNGVFYQIPSDGNPVQIAPSETAPYATITYFSTDKSFTVADLNYTQLKTQLDSALSSQDAIYAIKVSGTFDYAQTRSPQKQSQPYPALTDALKTQSVFSLSNVSATAVGFWFPSSMSGVDYVGYHLHLITDDRSAGGHILDCIIRNATVEIDQIKQYNLVLP